MSATVLDNAIFQGILIAVAAAGIVAMATITVRFFNGKHLMRVRKRNDELGEDAAMRRFIFGTEADKYTGAEAQPGAIVTFPMLQKDMTEVKDMVGDILVLVRGGNGPQV